MNIRKLIKYVSFTFILLFGLVFDVKAETYVDVSTKDELIQAVTNGKNIKLVSNILSDEELIINNSISIDLNGYTYTSTNSSTSVGIKVLGANVLTIEDSVGTGVITNTLTTTSPKTIYVDEGATLKLNSGSILIDSIKIGTIIGIGKDATFIMNGGVVKNNTTKSSTAVSASGANSNVIIIGGELANESGKVISLSVTSSHLQMIGGKLSGKQAVVSNGITEISGGEIIGTKSAISHTGSKKIVISNIAIEGDISVKDSKEFEFDESSVLIDGRKYNKVNFISNDSFATKSVTATNAKNISESLFLAAAGDVVTISLIPKDNEKLLDFSVLDGEGNVIVVDTTGTTDGLYKYTFTMPSKSIMLKSKYKTHKIIQKLSDGVTSNMPEVVEVGYNAITRFEYTIQDGYVLAYIKRDGEEHTSKVTGKMTRSSVSNSLSIGKVDDDTEIEVMALRINHPITSGNNSVLEENKADNLEIVVDTTQTVRKVTLNDVELDSKYYTVIGNKVTIVKDYINTLASGIYKVEITYDDNSISIAQFEVKKSSTSTDVIITDNSSSDSEKNDLKVNNPKTGDNILMYLIFGLLSIAGFVFSLRKLKKS